MRDEELFVFNDELKMLDDHFKWEFSENFDDDIIIITDPETGKKSEYPYEMTLSPYISDEQCSRVLIDGTYYYFG